jgi:hypothetical protein
MRSLITICISLWSVLLCIYLLTSLLSLYHYWLDIIIIDTEVHMILHLSSLSITIDFMTVHMITCIHSLCDSCRWDLYLFTLFNYRQHSSLCVYQYCCIWILNHDTLLLSTQWTWILICNTVILTNHWYICNHSLFLYQVILMLYCYSVSWLTRITITCTRSYISMIINW